MRIKRQPFQPDAKDLGDRETTLAKETHLCLIDVIQVPSPTGVELAPSCAERPWFLEKYIQVGGADWSSPTRNGHFRLALQGLEQN